MNRNAHRIGSLSPLLEGEEKLLTPIYGTLVQKKRRWSGYFGLTGYHLLIALLGENGQAVQWSTRVPLEMRNVTVKKGCFLCNTTSAWNFVRGKRDTFSLPKRCWAWKTKEKT